MAATVNRPQARVQTSTQEAATSKPARHVVASEQPLELLAVLEALPRILMHLHVRIPVHPHSSRDVLGHVGVGDPSCTRGALTLCNVYPEF